MADSGVSQHERNHLRHRQRGVEREAVDRSLCGSLRCALGGPRCRPHRAGGLRWGRGPGDRQRLLRVAQAGFRDDSGPLRGHHGAGIPRILPGQGAAAEPLQGQPQLRAPHGRHLREQRDSQPPEHLHLGDGLLGRTPRQDARDEDNREEHGRHRGERRPEV